jgi:hypothetical protein
MDAPEYLAEGLGLPAILGTLASGPRGWMKKVIEGLGKRSIAKGKVLPTRSAKTTKDVPLKKTSGGNYKVIDPDQPIKYRPDGTAYQTIDSVGSPRMKSYYDAGTERITDVAKHGAVLGGTGGATYLAASNLMDGSGGVQAEDVDETVTSEEIERLTAELDRLSNMSPAEIQVERDKKKRDEEIAATIAADKEAKDLAEETERDRRAALPDSARMLEDAMANVPENQTFQDYLSTLEGMEESRKGQVLMDLGAAIANASHGGDIAKGFQEAGTKARAEKIEVAKERARVLGESRAMDLDVALKMATIEADLEKQTGRTLQELLALLQMNEDFIIDNYPESAESIMQQIRAAIEVSLPQVTEQATE